MVDLTLVSATDSEVLASKIRHSVEHTGHTVHDTVLDGRKSLTILVLSNEAIDDQRFEMAMFTALDNHQHIIPILAQDVETPRLIDHLQPLDFRAGYDEKHLLSAINIWSAPNAPPPATVLTPAQKQSNRRFGVGVVAITIVVFVVSVYAIAVLGLRAPDEEFASVETQIILTRNYYIDGALPRSTEDALNFEATFEQNPTRSQLQLGLTTTAIAEGVIGTFVPQSTAQATQFVETLERVSTIVQEPLAATATAVAGE